MITEERKSAAVSCPSCGGVRVHIDPSVPIQVIILQRPVEQMMRTRVPRTLAAARMDSAVSPPRCVTLLKQTAPRRIAPFFPLLSRSSRSHTRARPLSSGVVLSDTHHQLCNPPYSAARLNKWLVSEAVSVYRLPILSLFWGLKGRLSLGDGQSPGFIDFFPSPLFVRSVQTADLKDRRDRTHARTPRALSWWSTTALCFFFFFFTSEGRRRG